MKRNWILPTLLAMMVSRCQAQQVQPQPYRLMSGRMIYPKSIAKLIAPNMPKENGYVYIYQTEINTDNVQAVHQEAVEIWQELKPKFEQIQGITMVIIQADEKPSGFFIQEYKTYRSVLTRKPNGIWEWTQDKPKESPPAP